MEWCIYLKIDNLDKNIKGKIDILFIEYILFNTVHSDHGLPPHLPDLFQLPTVAIKNLKLHILIFFFKQANKTDKWVIFFNF